MIFDHSSVVSAVEVLERDRLVVGGVVDQDVEAAEALHHVVDQALDLRRLRQVALEGLRLDAVLADLVRDRAGLVGALRIDHRDVGAGRGERMADALAQPAIAAGDDRDRILEIHERVSRKSSKRRPAAGSNDL